MNEITIVRENVCVAIKKAMAYVDEDPLRSVKVLEASTDSEVYEVLDEALRKHLGEPGKDAEVVGDIKGNRGESLDGAISRFGDRRSLQERAAIQEKRSSL